MIMSRILPLYATACIFHAFGESLHYFHAGMPDDLTRLVDVNGNNKEYKQTERQFL